HQVEDYDIIERNLHLVYPTIVAINLSKSPILHCSGKHTETFMSNENDLGDIYTKPLPQDKLKWSLNLNFMSNENDLCDIYIEPLPQDKFVHIKNLLGMTFIKE
ncbi:hypothetical protein CR513_55323, partial [Mucuna pruriens]